MRQIFRKGFASLLIMFGILPSHLLAQSGPPELPPIPDGVLLDAWEFSGTNYLSLRHSTPLSLTNVSLVPTWDGNGLQVDDTNAAWITYPVVEPTGHTNLDLSQGTIEMWFSPDWNSSDGLGNWAPLLEVGTWNTNLASAAGAWGLYISPDGSGLYFSSQTNSAITNYLNAPINWNAGDWHQIVLTYSATNSALYLEGALVTNGPGITILPNAEVLSNGFAIGSDGNGTGLLQSRGLFNAIAIFNYQLDADTIAWDYADDSQYVYPLPSSRGGGHFTMDDGPTLPGGLGGTNYSGGGGTPDFTPPSYTTNDFWLEALQLGTNIYNTNANSLTVLLHGTVAEFAYQLLSTTNLQGTNTIWIGEQSLIGSDITNFTPAIISMTGRSNLFLKAMAYTLDSDGDGLPDWWENKYSTTGFPLSATNADTGNTGIQDGDKQDSAGDGYSNVEKYQMGVPPGTWVTPRSPSGFSTILNSGGPSATLTWNPSLGNVTGYTILVQTNTPPAWYGQTPSGFVVLTNLSASQTNFTDYSEPFTNGVQYEIKANYSGSYSALTGSSDPSIQPALTTDTQVVRGPGGHPYLVVSAMPQGVTAYRVILGDDGTYLEDMWYPILDVGSGNIHEIGSVSNAFFDVSVSDITNGVYRISDSQIPLYAGQHFRVQALATNGFKGNVVDYGNTGWGTYRGSPTPWIGWADTSVNIPFIDGRSNIAQNINFQLQAGQVFYPFQVSAIGSTVLHDSSQTNYVNAGYHFSWQIFTDSGNYYQVNLNEFQPFEENDLYSQFCYSLNTLSSDGFLTNSVDPGGGIGTLAAPGIAPGCPFPFDTYGFVSSGNTNAPAGVLSSTALQWIFYANWQDQGQGFLPNGDYSEFTLETSVKNVYGLNVSSAKWAGTNSPLTFPTITPVTTIPNVSGASFMGVQQPVLTAVVYYFARPNIDIFPGQPGFSPTNTTASPIIVPFGQHSAINGWAKQSLENGHFATFAYPEQYFDKALLADTNGNITTNQTGLLSEYGDFFPTQPGKVFLTTKADGATGTTGQCPVYVVKIQLDVNHDGTMDTSYAGPDNTSSDRPYRFWVNSDSDRPASFLHSEGDANDPSHPDYNLQNIPSARDLEDWARLWICGLPTLPTNYQVTLSWNVISGNPSINLVKPYETNGGTLYLTDTNIAAEQSGGNSLFTPSYKFANVSPASPCQLSIYDFQGGTNSCLLFEGAGVGKGELVLTISANGKNIASTSAFMDLKEVSDMFEHAHIDNAPVSPPSTTLSDVSTYVIDNSVPVDPNDGSNVVVFVHGWRLTQWAQENFSETMFKRLWWEGYQGRFAALRWPTLSDETSGPLIEYLTFNRDEYIAYKCAQGATNYFANLHQRFPGYAINAVAHSHGNVLMMEVMKRFLASGQSPIHNYALLQAAVAAECLDTNAASYAPFYNTNTLPDTFYNYAGPIKNALASKGGVSGKMVNFYNTNDFGVVTCWEPNQELTKPDGRYGYLYVTNTAFRASIGSSRTITDAQEKMAFVAMPQTQAVGAVPNLGGSLSTSDQVNLQSVVGFTGDWREHSGEFNWPIQQLHPFFEHLLDLLQ